MVAKFIVMCLLTCNTLFAQYNPVSTQFDSFIIRPTIEWACYANDYLNFENYNLNKLLYNRFVKREIKGSSPIASGTNSANDIYFTTKDKLDDERLYPLCVLPIYDSNGNYPDLKIEPSEIDTGSSTITNISHILYIENGILKSYVTWVSPEIVRVTTVQTKQFIGYSEYLSTCFNYKYDYLPKESNKNIYLGESTRNFNMDSIANRSRLKELYGRNLLTTLIAYYKNNKLDISPIESDIKLKPEELENHYDSSGNFIQYKYLGNHSSLEDFKEIQLVQDWYYNYTENIVFNKISGVYLCAKKMAIDGEGNETSPLLKIVLR